MQRMPENKQGIVIVGAGPVGSMLALMLNTLLPDQPIDVFEKRHGDVRGHGLNIHKATINEMNTLLDQAIQNIKLHLSVMLREQPDLNKHYVSVMQKIAKVKAFLNNEVAGKFIRTGKISEMARDLVREQGGKQVRFHLDSELTGHDIQGLNDPANHALDEDQTLKQRALQSAQYIFAADGSHSGIRASVFNESTADLRKNVLSYLLEIKLEMCDKHEVNKTLDVLQRQVLPTLKSGKLHIWNQSADGTATLHVFINKRTYDVLHVQQEDGRFKGEFAYPYRRLIDLPPSVSGFIQRLIVDVIDENKMDASTIKITVLPLQVYVARKLLTTCNNKTIALTGDAGIGLALARGVNNGFFSAARYALALFQERMIDEFTPDAKADFSKYSAFWNEQQAHLEAIIFFLDETKPVKKVSPANRQATILEEYDKVYDALFKAKTSSATTYARNFHSLRDNFQHVLLNREDVRGLNANASQQLVQLINTLFARLENQHLIRELTPPELFQCQRDIFLRANSKIADAKFEVQLIDKSAKIHHVLTKSTLDSDEDVSLLPNLFSMQRVESAIETELAKLRLVLMQIDLLQNPHYSQWVFQLDLMYLTLARKINQIPLEFIQLVTAYVTNLPENGPAASHLFSEKARLYLNTTMVDKIITAGNYLFNPVRRSVVLMPIDELIKRAVQGVINYENANGEQSFFFKHFQDGNTGVARAQAYKLLLTGSDEPLIKLAVIYALFNHASAPQLRLTLVKAILDPDQHDLQLALPPTELESQVMLEVLQNRLAADLDTKKWRVLKNYALVIVAGIDNKKLETEQAVLPFKRMLAELGELRRSNESHIIHAVIEQADNHYTRLRNSKRFDDDKMPSLSKVSRVSKMNMFKVEELADPAYLHLLKDDAVSVKFKMALISALLASKSTSATLKSSITEKLFGKNHYLKLNQIIEFIDSQLIAGMNIEQLTVYKSRLFKLKIAVNDNSDLRKMEQPFMELLASVGRDMLPGVSVK